jgi:hypothetical protein
MFVFAFSGCNFNVLQSGAEHVMHYYGYGQNTEHSPPYNYLACEMLSKNLTEVGRV